MKQSTSKIIHAMGLKLAEGTGGPFKQAYEKASQHPKGLNVLENLVEDIALALMDVGLDKSKAWAMAEDYDRGLADLDADYPEVAKKMAEHLGELMTEAEQD